MAGNTISITMTSDDRDVISSFRDQNSQIIRNQEALRKMGTAGKKAHQENETGLGKVKNAAVGVASSVGLITSGVGLASAAVRILIADFEALQRRQELAARSQVEFAPAVKQAIINAPSQTPAQVESSVSRISKATGALPRDVALTLSSASSAKGKLPFSAAEEATREALRLTADLPEAQESFAGVALDIRNLFPKATAQDALGFSLSLGSNARIVNPADIAGNLVPGAIDLARNGSSLRNAGAVGAAITFGSGDTTGKTSRTASTALDVQLRKAFPEIDGIGKQIDFLQNNPGARKAFLEGGDFQGREIKPASFEKKVIGAIESLLTAGSDVDQTFRNAQKNLPNLLEAGPIFENRIQQLQGANSQRTARVDRSFKSATERARNRDVNSALGFATKEGLVELFDSQGDGAVAAFRTRRQFETETAFGTRDPVGGTIRLIEARLDEKFGPGRISGRELTPEQNEQAAELRSIVKELREIKAQGQQTAKVEIVNTRGKRPRQPKAAENNRN